MIFYIGLVGSGKTTLYRKLNEEKQAYAVEMEFPQSCRYDEQLKETIFKAYYNSKNIDVIIAHPYYLPENFFQLINKDDEIYFLPTTDIKEREARAVARSQANGINKSIIFLNEFYEQEYKDYCEFLQKYEDFKK